MMAYLPMLRDRRRQLLLSYFRPVQFDVKSWLANAAGYTWNIGHGLQCNEKTSSRNILQCANCRCLLAEKRPPERVTTFM